MSHPNFDALLGELRHHHLSAEGPPTLEDLFSLATDLGLSPGSALLLGLHQRWAQVRQALRTTGEKPSRFLLRPLLLELANEALWTLLCLEEENLGPQTSVRRVHRSRKG